MISFLVTKYRQLDEILKRRNRLRFEARRIDIHDHGFDIIDLKSNRSSVIWARVNCINVAKRDWFSFDQICFEFYQAGVELPIEVNENMEGFELLSETLPNKFHGFDRDWFSKVVKPAFAPNFTEVWKRTPGTK